MKIKQILLFALLVSIVCTDQAVSAVAGNDAVVIQNQTEADSVVKQFKKDIQCLRKGTCTKEQKIRLFKQALGLIAFVGAATTGGSFLIWKQTMPQLENKYKRLEGEWDSLISKFDTESVAKSVSEVVKEFSNESFSHQRNLKSVFKHVFSADELVAFPHYSRESLKLAIKHREQAISVAKELLKERKTSED